MLFVVWDNEKLKLSPTEERFTRGYTYSANYIVTLSKVIVLERLYSRLSSLLPSLTHFI